MSIQSQAVLAGHISIDEIAEFLRDKCGYTTSVRAMRHEQYKLIEAALDPEIPFVFHVFLESYAAEDYAAAYREPSTLVSVEYSPEAFTIVSALANHFGGLHRRTDSTPWEAATV